MRVREVVARIKLRGGVEVRQRGSHRMFRACGPGGAVAQTTVPDHGGNDLGVGLLRAIERQLAPAFGEGWLR